MVPHRKPSLTSDPGHRERGHKGPHAEPGRWVALAFGQMTCVDHDVAF